MKLKKQIYDEEYTFPVKFDKCHNVGNIGKFGSLDKNIRYRIYNYVRVDDNVAMARTSKSMYLDMRMWFKLYLPVNLPGSVDIANREKCCKCDSISKKHIFTLPKKQNNQVLVATSATTAKWISASNSDDKELKKCGKRIYDKLLYMCRSRNENIPICGPEINKSICDYLIPPSDYQSIPEQIGGAYVYNFSLYPEQHQPSGSVNWSRIDGSTIDFNFDYSICWKCYYLLS